MDLPQPPQEQELKNIIDKLAQFVARNGPEFEQMTKTKQKDNAKFSFLFGGEFFNYYQYKVTTEQAILKHRQSKDQNSPNQGNRNPMMQGPPVQNQGPPGHNQGPPGQNQGPPYQGSDRRGYHDQYNYNYGPGPGPHYGDSGHYPPPMGSNYPPHHAPYNMPPIPGEGMQMPGGPPPMGGPNYQPPNSTFPPGEPQYPHPQGFPGRTPDGPYMQQPPPIMNQPTEMAPNNRRIYPTNNAPQSGSPPPDSVLPPAEHHVPGAGSSMIPPANELAKSLENLLQEQQQLQEQIKQSEENLTAQQQVLDQQKESQVNEALYVALGETIRKEATTLGLDIAEFDSVMNPITESCTKDSISNGKHLIFTHATSTEKNDWIASYLLYRTTCENGVFTHKLHIIYLMNDVLYNCLRKNADALKDALETVLPPMYCHAVGCASEEFKAKLNKLLTLWETKMNLRAHLIEQLNSPEETWKTYLDQLKAKFPQVIATVTSHLASTFDGYKQQHNAFVQHANTQLQQLEQNKAQIEQQQKLQRDQQAAPPPNGAPFMPYPNNAPNMPYGGLPNQPPRSMDFNLPPPGFNGPPQGSLPPVDFSKPPPGFVVEEKESLVPTVPYFELPAALMAPLVHTWQKKFVPLDPAKLRLPMPTPPTERLLAAVESFYQPPCQNSPRNCDGWEQLALFDYYKAKAQGVKEKERLIEDGHIQPSRSPSPVIIEELPEEESKAPQKPVRRYRSVSPEDSSASNSDSGNRTPVSRSPSRMSRRTPSPPNSPRRRSRSKSRSVTPPSMFMRRDRSITPPSFGAPPPSSSGGILDESNKGHQMLRSMGWGGMGLGANEQGISVPISSGDVRDTPAEKFRGLGASSSQNDPFEAFRKNKGQAFINRIKQRAEERSGT